MITSVRSSAKSAPPLLPEARERMISDAAYFLAEQRGFQGDESLKMQDWLVAETMIDQMFAVLPIAL